MGLNIDLDRARQVVQGLKGLGDHLVPAGAPAAESAGPEKSVAAASAVSASGDHVAKEYGALLQDAAAFLGRAVQAFESMDQNNAANIHSSGPQNM
ncbi:hypothetical protein IUQ79_04835 [Mycobacteroides abscessus subsp. bolletii]|uniref:hypothetical protein n=1 Tax=Mycobacteroides abscessus TaxID=36809 RepID=UPI0019CF8550|nr:hypothetical protein [Mycobacteroides abscessus]MBN7301209.1 hypothetical protein [Mycobacteroides abscessus subsp. bolletii]